MNLSELAQYISDEEKVEQVLREPGILKRYTPCPFCGKNHIGRVRRFKFTCYRCNKEWGVRRGSIREGLKIPFTKFLMAIKLFELDTPVRESAKQTGLSLMLSIIPIRYVGMLSLSPILTTDRSLAR